MLPQAPKLPILPIVTGIILVITTVFATLYVMSLFPDPAIAGLEKEMERKREEIRKSDERVKALEQEKIKLQMALAKSTQKIRILDSTAIVSGEAIYAIRREHYRTDSIFATYDLYALQRFFARELSKSDYF